MLLALDCPAHHPLDKLPLEEDNHDEWKNSYDDNSCEEQVPLRAKLADEDV